MTHTKRLVLTVLLLLMALARAWPQQTELVIQTGHRLGQFVAVTPDGKFIVNTGALMPEGCLGDLKLWDRDGRLLRVIQSGFDGWFNSIAFSPDGTRIACSGTFKERTRSGAEVWDLYGRLVCRVGEPEIRRGLQVAFSPDSRQLAGCGQDAAGRDKICLWSAAGAKSFELALPTNGETDAILFTPDGRSVVCLLAKTGLAVLDLQTRMLTIVPVRDTADENNHLEGLAVSPDGTTVASCLVLSEDPEEPESDFDPYRRRLRPLLWSRNGWRSAGSLEETLSNVINPFGGLTFAASDRLVVGANYQTIEQRGRSATFDYHYVVKEYRLSGIGTHDLAGGDGMLHGIVRTVEGGIAASGDAIRLWNGRGDLQLAIPDSWVNPKGTISFSPDGSSFLVGIAPVRLWSIDGRLLAQLTFAPDRFPRAIAFTAEGNILAAHEKGYDVFDARGRPVAHYEAVEGWARYSFEIETDGRRVFVPETEEGVWVLDVASGDGFAIGGGRHQVVAGADGESFACFRQWGYEGITVHNRRGEEIQNIAANRNDRILSAALGPGGVVAWLTDRFERSDRAVSLWIRQPGAGAPRQIPLPLARGFSERYRIGAGPGGMFVVFSNDTTAPLWIYSASGALLHRLEGRQGGVIAAAFTPDGKGLVSYGMDSSLRIWNLGSRQSAVLLSDGREWISYTDDLYFDASPRGGRLLALVQGLKAYAVEQVALMRNRPDLICRRLGIGTDDAVRYFYRQYIKRLVKAERIPGRIPADVFEKQILAQTSDVAASKLLRSCYARAGNAYELKAMIPLDEKYRLLAIPALIGYVEAAAAGPLHASEAQIISSRREGDFLRLRCRFADARVPLSRYNVYVNDVPVYEGLGKPLSGSNVEIEERVELSAGTNKVEVACVNASLTESLRDAVEVNVDRPSRGSLYYIGFGVSAYKDKELTLVYPRKDVEDLQQAFRGMGDRFDHVYAHVFTDGECTPGAIRDAKGLLQKAGVDDTVVLFISGHGVHDRDPNATYYFLTHAAQVDNLAQTAADFELIEDILAGIRPRKKLFLMDTCESGEHDEEQIARFLAAASARGLKARAVPALAQRGLAASVGSPRAFLLEKDRYIHNDLFRRTGGIVFSSCRGGEFSYEPLDYSPSENGYFTSAVLKSLRFPAADADGDGAVSTDELRSYVTEEVSIRSDGLQHPTVDRDNIFLHFVFPLPAASLENADPKDLSGYLAAAARAGNTPVVAELLRRGSRLPPQLAADVLVEAAGNGATDIVRLLLQHGADPAARDRSGVSAAKRAFDRGHRELALVLVEAGAEVPARAVIDAHERGYLPRMRAALASGRRVERNGRQDAFWQAVQLGYREPVEIYLRAGVNAGEGVLGGASPAKLATQLGHREVVRLLEEKIDLAVKVMAAVDRGDNAELSRLIAAGAFAGVRYIYEMDTPLITACRRGDPVAVRILLRAGADPDEHDPDGFTALIVAAQAGTAEIVEQLLDSRADPDLRTVRGLTALLAASREGHAAVAELLRSRGAGR